jgi:hypothetical protein
MEQTSSRGDADFAVAIDSSPLVSVPPLVEFQNSTRIIFTQWNDGVTQPQRHVLIDGDTSLTAYYKIQYLLTVNSSSTSEEWYDRGTTATISAPTSASVTWPLSFFGVTKTFHGWSGDIQSSLPQLSVTMDSPKTIVTEYTTDYGPLAVPAILGLGIVAAAISFVLIRPRSGGAEQTTVQAAGEVSIPDSNSTCPTCGQTTEQGWTHCIKCGAKLEHADQSTNEG